MEELLKKFKLGVKKVLQDHVASGLPIGDSNTNGTDLLLSLEEIFRYGLQSQVYGSVVTLWNFFCLLSRIGGDIGLHGSAVEKEVLSVSREWTSDDSKAKMWLRCAMNSRKFKLVQCLVADEKLMENWYQPFAFLRNADYVPIFFDLFQSLESIGVNFSFAIEDPTAHAPSIDSNLEVVAFRVKKKSVKKKDNGVQPSPNSFRLVEEKRREEERRKEEEKKREEEKAKQAELQRQEELRKEEERKEQERIDLEKLDEERKERERKELAIIEAQRIEEKRILEEKQEAERKELARIREIERIEQEKRDEIERIERERLRAIEEAARIEQERRKEIERVEKEKQMRMEALRLIEEANNMERIRLENERIEALRLENETSEKAELVDNQSEVEREESESHHEPENAHADEPELVEKTQVSDEPIPLERKEVSEPILENGAVVPVEEADLQLNPTYEVPLEEALVESAAAMKLQREQVSMTEDENENNLASENFRLMQEISRLKDELVSVEKKRASEISEMKKSELALREELRSVSARLQDSEALNETLLEERAQTEREASKSNETDTLVAKLKEQVETLQLERTIFEKRWDKDQEEIRNLKKNVTRSPLLSSDYLEKLQNQSLEIAKLEKEKLAFQDEKVTVIDHYESEISYVREKYQQKCDEFEEAKTNFQHQLEEQRNILISQYMSQLHIERSRLKQQFLDGHLLEEVRNERKPDFNPEEFKRNTQSDEDDHERYESKDAASQAVYQDDSSDSSAEEAATASFKVQRPITLQLEDFLNDRYDPNSLPNNPVVLVDRPSKLPKEGDPDFVITDDTGIWKPPKKQLYFAEPKAMGKTSDQNELCYGCGTALVTGWFSAPVYCHYSNKYYCNKCQGNDKFIIPAKILWHWDFKLYPVSTFYYEFLKDVQKEPLFDLQTINIGLFKKVPALNRIRAARRQLNRMKEFVLNCREKNKLVTPLNERFYLVDTVMYSLNDLVRVQKGELLQLVQDVSALWLKHITQCKTCTARAKICEYCKSYVERIFPFDVKNSVQCKKCKCFVHLYCYKPNACPKCKEIEKESKKEDNSNSNDSLDEYIELSKNILKSRKSLK